MLLECTCCFSAVRDCLLLGQWARAGAPISFWLRTDSLR